MCSLRLIALRNNWSKDHFNNYLQLVANNVKAAKYYTNLQHESSKFAEIARIDKMGQILNKVVVVSYL